MKTVEVLIRIPQVYYDYILSQGDTRGTPHLAEAITNGIVLPKEHGKIVDLGKIDKDRIEQDNPVIYLTVNGEYTEAVSLDYLNNLQAIIEADKEE